MFWSYIQEPRRILSALVVTKNQSYKIILLKFPVYPEVVQYSIQPFWAPTALPSRTMKTSESFGSICCYYTFGYDSWCFHISRKLEIINSQFLKSMFNIVFHAWKSKYFFLFDCCSSSPDVFKAILLSFRSTLPINDSYWKTVGRKCFYKGKLTDSKHQLVSEIMTFM